jgi:ubiquinone/menaquinone biosynthesis C-methylase UbiE
MSLQKDSDRNEIKFLRKLVDLKDKYVLEVGCGEGRLTWQYVDATRLTVGVDVDGDSLRVARVDCPSDVKDIVHLARADSTHLPFAKEKFDIAILAWSL